MAERLGRYRLLELLGRGGTARVYRAELEGPYGFRKTVALKILDTPKDGVPETLLAEARLGGLIQHPNVVSTLEVGEDRGRWFIAMEFVNGPTANRLLRQGPLPLRAVLDIGAQTAAGLHYLHTLDVDGQSKPLVHRDIKPSNLLLDPSGLVRIVDLGIAGFTTSSKVAGTPGYMAPEQVDGHTSPQSDIFALGCTLYRLLTAERLFGKGRRAIFRTFQVDALTGDPSFQEKLDAIHPHLAPLLRSCLALDPAKRWSSAEALGQAIRQLLIEVDGPSIAELVGAPVDLPDPIGAEPHTFEPATLPQLPPGPLVGRAATMGQILRDLASGPVVLTGPAGIGKTRLALETVHRHRRSVWVRLVNRTPLASLIATIARAAGVPSPGDHDLRALLVNIANLGCTLVAIDGGDHLDPSSWAHIERLGPLPLALLLTSREPPPVEVPAIEVPPLTLDQARELFLANAPDQVPDTALLERLDGTPLAIELAAAADITPELPTSTDPGRPVTAAIRSTWASLSETERAVLLQLSCFAGAFRPEDAASVVRLTDRAWVVDRLGGLLERRVLEARGSRYVLPPSVKRFANELLTTEERLAIRDRHALHFAQFGSRAMIDRLDMPDSDRMIRRLYAANDDLIAAFEHASEHLPSAMPGLATARLAVILYAGPTEEGLRIVKRTIRAATGSALLELLRLGFVAAYRAGRWNRAMALARLGQRNARGSDQLGEFYWMRGLLSPFEKRTIWYDRAEREARRTAQPLLLSKIENSRSVLARIQGDLDAATAHNEAALEYATRAGSEPMISLALTNRASVHFLRGKLDLAAADHQRAMALQRRQRSHAAWLMTLLDLTVIKLQQGYLRTTRDLLTTCWNRIPTLGMGRLRAQLLHSQATYDSLVGKPDDAKRHFEGALEAARHTNNVRVACSSLVALAHLAMDRDALDEARTLLPPADQAPPSVRGRWIDARARLCALAGESPEALIERAHVIESEVGTPWARCWCTMARARLLPDQRDQLLDEVDSFARHTLGLGPRSPIRQVIRSIRSEDPA